MAFAWLLDPQHQIMTKSGTINVGGKIRVFDAATDDPVVTYKDFSGTANDEAITLDNNGRACIIADSARAYRVEVYDRYNTLLWTVTPVWCMASGGGIDNLVNIISSDGTVNIVKTSSGGITSFDLSIYPDNVDSSVIVARSATLSEDGTFQFTEAPMAKSGVLLDILGNQISARVGWYHFDASVEVTYAGTPINQETPVVVTGPNCAEHISYDMSYPHTEYITVEGDYEIQSNWTPLSFAIQGMGDGMSARVVNASVHEIIKEVGGFVQENADWDATSGVAEILNKPDLSVYATNAALTYGLAGKQDTIGDLDTIRSGAALGATSVQPAEFNSALAQKQDTISDLSAIRSGAQAGASAVQPADLAAVATTGSYNDLNNRPNLTVYATTEAMNTALATKQDVIGDLSDIRSGAQAGSTAVQPGDLATVATTGSYDDLVDKPTIPAAQVNSDWDATSGVTAILNRPNLAAVATTGDYDDLSNKPSIPAAQVNADWDATSGVEQILNRPNLATVATSGSYNDLVNTPSIPTATSDLTNDSGFITSSDVPVKDVQVEGVSVVNAQGVAEISIPATGVLDVEVDGTSVVNAQGVAEITMPAVPTKTSDLQNDSGYITLSDVPAQANADWDSTSGASEILHKPDLSIYAQSSSLATVATTGDYDDLIDKPDLSVFAQSSDLATVATTGDYADLINTPSIPAAQVNSDWDATSGVSQILNRPNLATVATTGAYSDLSGTPTINNVPAVTSNDDSKVLKASYSGGVGSYSWEAESGGTVTDVEVNGSSVVSGGVASITIPAQVNADWDATSGTAEILNKPVPKTLTAGTGISITESANEITVANTVTPPTVDQTYDASSTNAQSGVAVASAISAIGTWVDVSTEAQYNTTPILAGGFEIKYNASLKLVSVTADVNLDAGAANIFTWSNRLKPVANAFALGNGLTLYVSQTSLNQPAAATQRWVNGVWMWPVVGDN